MDMHGVQTAGANNLTITHCSQLQIHPRRKAAASVVLFLRAWTQCGELGAVRILHALQTHRKVSSPASPLHGVMLAMQAVTESRFIACKFIHILTLH